MATTELRPLALTDVEITSGFWSPRLETNRRVTLPYQYWMCKETGRIDAWRLEWKPGMPDPPHIFWDSDVAKWIEAASYALATHPDPELERLVDEVIALAQHAQQPDGYLNAHYTVVEPDKRWTNLRDCHELYCAGHLIEAGVAHYQATGKRTLLDVVCRYADYIATVFGRGEGQKRGYCGHEEIELALVKLWRATGEGRYLDLARYFVDERGQQPHYFDIEARARGEDPSRFWADNYAYCQAHRPLREQTEVVGHAVRAFYIYSAMADLAGITGDEALLRACRLLWHDATARKMYVTGGVGPSSRNEGFTTAYDLPNESAYAETCAAIALGFFAHRLLQIEADGRYADVLERVLYNGALSGVSLDGKRFFYANPLASSGSVARSDWFGCACCPPNIARLLASLGLYLYSAASNALYVHVYAGGSARARVAGTEVTLRQATDYPWDGDVRFTVEVPAPALFDLMLRVPGWCRSYQLAVNGDPAAAPVVKGYACLSRTWHSSDVVELKLAMPVERVVAHPQVAEDAGRVALQRGPIIYCLEQPDNPAPVRAVRLPAGAALRTRFDPDLLGGVTLIEGEALVPASEGWEGALYRFADETRLEPTPFVAIPYACWNNRGAHPMTVFMPEA